MTIATCRNLAARVERSDWIVRQLGRSEVDTLLSPGCAGRPSRPNRLFQVMDETMPSAAWTAGLFVADELRGVVHARDASHEGAVEASLLVDERWQRQGIGSALLWETIDWARHREASTLRFVCERTDWPMRSFARKFDARLDLALGKIIIDFPLGRLQP